MPTSIHVYAKPDTVLLLDIVAGNDEVDYSQSRTNLTNNTTYLTEANSARTALSGNREVAVVVQLTSSDTGILVNHGNGGATSYRLTINVAGTVLAQENGSTVVSLALPSLAVSERNVLICWSQFQYGSSVRSEVFAYNYTAGTFAYAAATHSETVPSASDTLTINGQHGGGGGHSGGLADWLYLRIGRRHHSVTEVREDWLGQSSPPTMTQTRRLAPLLPDRTNITDMAADDALCGPEYLWSGHVFTHADRRLVGPIVNARIQNPVTITYAYAEDLTAWWRTAPGDSTLRMTSALLWRCPVPLKVNRAYARVWLRMNNGAAATVATATVRVYSMANLPVVGEPDASLVYHRTDAVTRATDDGTAAGVGALATPGALDLAVDASGYTWIAVAVKFDEAHAQIANTELFVHMLTVDPYHEGTDGVGLGAEDA